MSTQPRPPALAGLAPTRAPRRSPRARFVSWCAWRDDAGFTLVEQIIAIGLATILGVIGVVAYQKINKLNDEVRQRTEVTTGIDDANGQLSRDVNDAISIRAADAQHLTLAVIRNGACNVRAYTASSTAKTLEVVTTYYEQESCSGASEDRTQVLVPRWTQPATFTFWGESETIAIPTPVQDVRNITRVQWDLAAEPYVDRNAPDVTLMSSQYFDGRGESSGSGTPELQAKRPYLTPTTAVPGRDDPSMTWTDPTPTLTAGWVVTRAREPEGSKPGSFLAIAWPDMGTLTFTDVTLQPGERATYVVYAILTDGSNGPSSNSIDTGRRPLPPASVTATGQPIGIKVDWAASPGGQGYDVYRDGVLAANVGAVTTWTDALDYGHSHTYQVVATNRWEQRLTTASETGRVPLGDAVDKVYSGGVRLASAVTAASGAYTAPAAPTITAIPSTTWTDTIAWTPAAWVGTGPASKGGMARDRGWETKSATLAGAFATLWAETSAGTTSRVNASRTPGSTTRYQVRTCNPAGCSPYSAAASSMQRPPAPASCTASGASTRGMTTTVNPAGMESPASAFRVTGGTGDPTGTGTSASPSFAIDQLTHSTTHSFTSATQNSSPANGGWSDGTSCQGPTAVLAVAITGTNSTTRTLTASMATTNGSSSSLTLEGVRTDANVASASWDPLTDGTAFTVTARNTDGFNNVFAQAPLSTAVLPTPSAPSCSASIIANVAPGSIQVSGGAQVKLGSGATYGSPHTFGGLGYGTHTGYARNINTDGYNEAASAWDSCGGKVIGEAPKVSDAICRQYAQEGVWGLDEDAKTKWKYSYYDAPRTTGGYFLPGYGTPGTGIWFGTTVLDENGGLTQKHGYCLTSLSRVVYAADGKDTGLILATTARYHEVSWWGY